MAKIVSLSKKDIKKINSELNLEISVKSKVQLVDDKYLIIDDNIELFKIDNFFVPTLKSKYLKLPTVTIDMPAVPFIAKGADLMRPGIVDMDSFEKDDFVLIIDENNKKGIAIGRSIYSSDELNSLEHGKVIINLHYVGDEIWNFSF